MKNYAGTHSILLDYFPNHCAVCGCPIEYISVQVCPGGEMPSWQKRELRKQKRTISNDDQLSLDELLKGAKL
jgi:hypothetical protein